MSMEKYWLNQLDKVSAKVRVNGRRGYGSGRSLVASTNLVSGDVVMIEAPIMTFPRLSGVLVCVNCLGRLDYLSTCTRCGLPLCNDCQGDDQADLHSRECQVLVHNDVKFTPTSNIEAKLLLSLTSVLRLLLLEKSNNWQDLESNIMERKQQAFSGSGSISGWRFVETKLVPLLTSLKNESGHFLFSQDDIHEAAGVLDTNCFQLKEVDKSGHVTRLGRCLYLNSSMFNNNCDPNCHRTIVNGQLEIWTVRPVSEGEELNICYVDQDMDVMDRSLVFRTSKQFECSCQRCVIEIYGKSLDNNHSCS